MAWGKTSDREEQRRRGNALTAAYKGPAGMPVYDRPSMASGSRGGAPIWVMAEAWMSKAGRSSSTWFDGHENGRGLAESGAADPDGFAVFGRYPKGFLTHVLSTQLLGATVRRDDVLHVCSGTLGPDEKWTVDLRMEARPGVVASGTALPFRDASFRAVMLDPPYSDEYARNLYKTENPRPSWLLKEAARVVTPGGRVGILHVAVPFAPPDCRLVKVYGISTGVGFRIRAFTIYERHQDGLAL